MDTTRYTVPVTDVPDPDAMSPRPALASLTKQKRVKLRLSSMAFEEMNRMMAALVGALNEEIEQHPWLEMASVDSRAGLALLLDVYEGQMQPLVLATPELVTLTLSRCEAHIIWKMWMLLELPATEVPALTAVMHELHYLLS